MGIIAISGKKQSGKSTIARIIQYHTAKEPWQVSLEEYLTSNWLYNSPNNNWEVKLFASKLKETVSLLTGISVQDLEKEEVKQLVFPEWKIWKLSFEAEHNDFEHTIDKWFPTEDEARDFIDENYLIKFELKEIIPDVRFLLQYIGTDLFRNRLHPDVWVNSLFNEYKYSHILSIIEPPVTEEKLANSIVYPKWIISDMRFLNESKAVQNRDGLCVRVVRPETDKFAGNHSSETDLDGKRDWNWVFDNSKDLNHLVDQIELFIKYYKL